MRFNDLLPKGHVVLAVDSLWCNDAGESEWAVIWSGEGVYRELISNGYVDKGVAVVDASNDERELASEWYQLNNKDVKSKVGCFVKLKRSRKAPNGVALKVVEWRESYFDRVYYRNYPEMACLDVDGERVWVSASCINELVKCGKPFWA